MAYSIERKEAILNNPNDFAALQAWVDADGDRQPALDESVDTCDLVRRATQSLPFESDEPEALGSRRTDHVILQTAQLDQC